MSKSTVYETLVLALIESTAQYLSEITSRQECPTRLENLNSSFLLLELALIDFKFNTCSTAPVNTQFFFVPIYVLGTYKMLDKKFHDNKNIIFVASHQGNSSHLTPTPDPHVATTCSIIIKKTTLHSFFISEL